MKTHPQGSHAFTAEPTARPLIKERVLSAMVMSLFFFLVYGSTNEISHLTGPHPSFSFAWEAGIPFVPAFIVPYMSLDAIFVAAFFVARRAGN